jgi:hypothetical protein
MQTHTSLLNSPPSHDRRRQLRHKLNLSPVVVVSLGPNNGGNVIDIGGGGISVQAVANLIPTAPLTLHFRLQGMAHPIEVDGRVAWVGPTKKVAGISFTNIPGATKQLIADWVATQSRSTQDVPPSDPATKSDKSAPPQSTISIYQPSPKERIVLPLHESVVTPTTDSKPLTGPLNFSLRVAPLSSKPLVLPKSVWSPSSVGVSSTSDRIFVAPEKSASESRWGRRGLTIKLVAVVIGILTLIFIGTNLSSQGTSQSIAWTDRVRAFFGMEVHKKMDPAKAGVQVWTVQRTGRFYCADDPNFQKLLPGAILTQAEAIQNGFQPNLDFCK